MRPMMHPQPSRAARWAPGLLGLVILIYLGLSAWGLKDPGVEYDEVLFGNAALGVQDHSFVAWSWQVGGRNLPVMLMPYIGALKAYIYYPVLHLLDASAITLRLPMILAGACALVLYTLIARRALGWRGALLFGLLLATDPSYLYHTRLDWGPVALMMLLKAAGAYLFLRWWETGRAWYLAASGFCLGLGIYDKVNFVWFVIAAGLAALLVFHRELRSRLTVRSLALFLGFGLLGMMPLVLYNLAFPLVTIREPFEAGEGLLGDGMARRIQVISETLTGVAVFKFVNGGESQSLFSGYLPFASSASTATGMLTSTPFGRGSLIALAAAASAAYLTAVCLLRPSRKNQAAVAAILASLFIVLQLFVTRKATGSYHVMMLYPLPQFLVTLAANDLYRRARSKTVLPWPRGLKEIIALCLALVVLSNALVDVGYLRYFAAEGGRGIWSSAIYDLVDYGRQHPEDRMVLMDWGFNTQLLTLSKGSIRKDEVFHWLTDGPSERERFGAYLADPNSLYVFHTQDFTKFPGARDVFQRILAAQGLQERRVETFYQKDGEPIYFVSRVVPAGQPLPAGQ